MVFLEKKDRPVVQHDAPRLLRMKGRQGGNRNLRPRLRLLRRLSLLTPGDCRRERKREQQGSSEQG